MSAPRECLCASVPGCCWVTVRELAVLSFRSRKTVHNTLGRLKVPRQRVTYGQPGRRHALVVVHVDQARRLLAVLRPSLYPSPGTPGRPGRGPGPEAGK